MLFEQGGAIALREASINNWSAVAYNQVPDAVNEIHGDKMAKQYGFKGGLVPGATVCAYLTHPAVEFYGFDYLNNGHSQVRLHSPLYDGSPFEVRIQPRTSSAYASFLYPVVLESKAL